MVRGADQLLAATDASAWNYGSWLPARSVRHPAGMTAPRQVLPGVTYLVTRRCFARMFLLRPSPLVNAVFEYVLALKAREYGIYIAKALIVATGVGNRALPAAGAR